MYIVYPFNVTIGYCPTIMYDNDLIMWETNSGMTIGHLWDNHWDDYDKPSPIINPTFWGSAFTTHM